MNPEQRIALTIPDAISYSGIGRTSLYKLFAEGKIIPRKAGKRTLILRSDLDEFILNLPTAQ